MSSEKNSIQVNNPSKLLCQRSYGDINIDECPVDELGLLVEEASFSGSLDIEEVGGPCTTAVIAKQPKLEISISGKIKSIAGLVGQILGTEVATLNNFTRIINGFDPKIGRMIFTGFTVTCSQSEATTAFEATITHYPFVA